MKKLIALCMALMLTCTLSIAKAQDVSKLSDKELSEKYKADMDVLKSEIKTLKLKQKADNDNVTLKSEIRQKTEDFNAVKDKKTVIDKAIKSRKASEKATQNAEKAQQKADKAEKAAKQVKEKEN
ncbi:MAG: hypothetical protein LBT24_04025 [Tannerella sp.]|jgi:phage-related tail fiber protein|nr:hypothetical protein [Tannerella sp.]